MGYQTDWEGNIYWEDDPQQPEQPPTPDPGSGADQGSDSGTGPGTEPTPSADPWGVISYSPYDIQQTILTSGALWSGTSMFDTVSSFKIPDNGPLSMSTSVFTSAEARDAAKKDSEKSFFDKMKESVTKSYEKDPIKFLQAGLAGIAGVYDASQKRKAADKLAESRIAEINTKYANEKDAQERYTNSLRTLGAGRQPNPQQKLTRVGGVPVYDSNGKYIRS